MSEEGIPYGPEPMSLQAEALALKIVEMLGKHKICQVPNRDPFAVVSLTEAEAQEICSRHELSVRLVQANFRISGGELYSVWHFSKLP